MSEMIANIYWHQAKGVDFTDLDVKAILSGKKTQFRKCVTVPRILRSLGCILENSSINQDDSLDECIKFHGSTRRGNISNQWVAIDYYCPFGRSGNYLWIKEPYQQTIDGQVIYRADLDKDDEGNSNAEPWISAGEMPVSLSRGTIEITNVRLQRLGLMTEDEAKAEGMQLSFYNPTYLQAFAKYWNKTTKQTDWYKFESCPLVWVVEFSSNIGLGEQLLETGDEVEEVFV